MIFGNWPMVLPMERFTTEIRIAGYPSCYSIFQRDLTSDRNYHWFSAFALSLNILVFAALVAMIAWSWRRWLDTSQLWKWSILEILAITLLVGLSLTWFRERAPFLGTTELKSKGVHSIHKDCSWLPKNYKKWSILRSIGCVSFPFATTIDVDEDLQFRTRKHEKWTNDLALIHAKDDDFAFLPSSSLIRQVYIRDGEIGEKGAAWLASLPNLEILKIKTSDLSRFPLEGIGQFKSLLLLDLDDTQISADHLEHVGRIPSLETLLVNTDQVGPKLWASIEGHPALQRLEISLPKKSKAKQRVSNTRIAIILKSLPNLRCVFHPGCEVDATLFDLPSLEGFYPNEIRFTSKATSIPSMFARMDIQDCPKLQVDAIIALNTDSVLHISNVKAMKLEIQSDDAKNVNAFLESLTEKENCNELTVTSASPMVLDKLPMGLETLTLEGVQIDFDRLSSELLSELATCKLVNIQSGQLDRLLVAAKKLQKVWLSTQDDQPQLTFTHENLAEVSIAFEVSDSSECRIDVSNCPKLEKLHIVTGAGPISFCIHDAPRLGTITSYLTGLKRTFHALKGKISLRELDIGEDFEIDPSHDLSFEEDGGYLKTLRLAKASPDVVVLFLTRSKLTWIDALKLENLAFPKFQSGFETLRAAEVQCRDCEVDASNFARLFSRKGMIKDGHFRKCNFRLPMASPEINSPPSKLSYAKLRFEKCDMDGESARWIGDHFVAQELQLIDCNGEYREILRSLAGTGSNRKLTIEKLDEEMIEILSGMDASITVKLSKETPSPELKQKLSQHVLIGRDSPLFFRP